jgi:monovalent cation/hydrogen antiporter
MTEPVLLVLGLVLSVILAIVARRLEVPYPIVFIVAGTALAFVPGLPPVHISPDWIFLAILPPLLFSAGWSTDWVIFRANLRPILQLAIGLVILTTVTVAALAQHMLPALGVAGAFVLGAIVSPPDAVAAGAVFDRFAVPRRIIAVIEGEGLFNDATALVIYAYAVAAATAAANAVSFSLPRAVGSFVVVAAGGILLGILVAWCVEQVSRMLTRYDLSDSLIENLLLLSAPYAAYLSAQALHISGVLAVVIAGIAISRRSSVVYGPQTRLIAFNVWSLWIYVLNAYVFLAIGLQLRTFVAQGSHFFALLPAALAVSALVIAVRLAWIYPAAWLPRLIPIVRKRDPLPPLGALSVIGWSGMRGIVSLAAALALPTSFPHRDVIVFVAYVVIFVTLVGQGLSLGPVLRWLKVFEEGDEEQRESDIRIRALQAGLRRITELEPDIRDDHLREDLDDLRSEYERRIAHLRNEAGTHHGSEIEALRAERLAIMALRDSGEIPDQIFRRIQYDLDLAESRLS